MANVNDFEEERAQVVEAMKLAPDAHTSKYLSHMLQHMTFEQAFAYRQKNPDIWGKHLPSSVEN